MSEAAILRILGLIDTAFVLWEELGLSLIHILERAIEIAGEYSDVVEAQQFIGFANTTATGSSTF